MVVHVWGMSIAMLEAFWGNCSPKLPLKSKALPLKRSRSVISIKKVSVMTINWSEEKETIIRSIYEFYWVYLSILASAHLPPGLSGQEGAWRRHAVHSCPRQLCTPFRGPMHRSWGLQAASGQVCVASFKILFSTEFLEEGAWIIAQTIERHPAGREFFTLIMLAISVLRWAEIWNVIWDF